MKACLDKQGYLKVTTETENRSVTIDAEHYPGVDDKNGYPSVNGATFIIREDTNGKFIEENRQTIPAVLTELYAHCKKEELAHPNGDEEYKDKNE